MMQFTLQHLQNSVTAPKGFKAAAVASGIRYHGRTDLAVIVSDVQAECAAVYTQNKFKAAPLVITEQNLANGKCQAFVCNSGIANAGMGEVGLNSARMMSDMTAKALNISADDVVVASTGVIGMPLPMDKLASGIEKAAQELDYNKGLDAAFAIMTTDLVVKECTLSYEYKGQTITIGGIAKGSGMIMPNMATMLSFVTTDANISAGALKTIIKKLVDKTFNMISVDGDTSTNDMVAVMANGMSGCDLLDNDSDGLDLFVQALGEVFLYLAKSIAKDGEGANKLVIATVKNAKDEHDAKLAAKAIINSSLVKTAIFGCDANWGRIACAVGYSGAEFEQGDVDIFIGSVQVAQKGMGIAFDEAKAKEILEQDEVEIMVDLGVGAATATAYGCDLSYEYVKINGSYRS